MCYLLLSTDQALCDLLLFLKLKKNNHKGKILGRGGRRKKYGVWDSHHSKKGVSEVPRPIILNPGATILKNTLKNNMCCSFLLWFIYIKFK